MAFFGTEGCAGGGAEGRTQIVGLRIGLVFEPGAPACIGLAGEQQLVEALRAAERIAVLQEREHGGGPKLLCAVHQGVVARGKHGKLAVAVRDL